MPPDQVNPARNNSTFLWLLRASLGVQVFKKTLFFEAASGVVIQVLHYRDTHKASD